MNINVIEMAKKIVTLRLHRFSVSKTATQLLHETGLEHYKSKGQYVINRTDIDEIQRYYTQLLGAPLTQFTQENNRIDATKTTNKEKSAKGGVFEALLSIVAIGELHLTTGVIPAGINTIISTEVENLVTDKIERLVVIENSELLVQSDRLIATLPEEWQSNTLVVYRGHGESQQQIKTLLRALKPSAQVAFYFDYDFSGMKLINAFMAYVSCPASIITPNHTDKKLNQLTNHENFAKQYLDGAHLLTRTEASSKHYEIVIHQVTLCLKNHKLAVTQEALVAHNTQLQSTPLNWREPNN